MSNLFSFGYYLHNELVFLNKVSKAVNNSFLLKITIIMTILVSSSITSWMYAIGN